MRTLIDSFVLTRQTSTDLGRKPSVTFELSPVKVPEVASSITLDTKRCCHCFQDINMAAYAECLKENRTFKNKPVLLPCDPSQHIVCTKKCFKEFVRNTTNEFKLPITSVRCPICGEDIPVDLIHTTFGGRQKFQNIVDSTRVEWMTCKECKDNKIDVVLKCGHGFCKMCIRGWYEIYRIQGKRNWKCPICKQPMHQEGSIQSLCMLL